MEQAPTRSSPKRKSRAWVVLVLLTLIAGTLRFVDLDRPSIWGDESATFGRIGGNARALVDQLSDDGMFTPLHYELYWWIAQGMPYWGTVSTADVTDRDGNVVQLRNFEPTKRIFPNGIEMTPRMMRLIPAIAGTLTVPAIYFLSRQLFGRRVSLIAAFFCCFSAYLMVYSRDAKMYMHFWLMCTLSVGCLLWWLRTRSATAWLCWVGSSLAMIGLQMLGGAVLAVEFLILLTASRQNLMGLLTLLLAPFWLLALPVVALWNKVAARYARTAWITTGTYLAFAKRRRLAFAWPPVVFFGLGMLLILKPVNDYYQDFNRRFDRAVKDEPGIVAAIDSARVDVGRVGVGWVEGYNYGRQLKDLSLYTTSAFLTGWEWPRKFKDLGIDEEAQIDPMRLKLLKVGTVSILVLASIGLVPWKRLLTRRRGHREQQLQDLPIERPVVSRRALWIGAWLLLPAYAFYCQSVEFPKSVLDAVSTVALQNPKSLEWARVTDGHIPWGTWRDQLVTFAGQFSETNLAFTRLMVIGACVLVLAILLAIRWRRMWRSTLRLACVTLSLLALCLLIQALPRYTTNSIWMPRYVAVIFPAFAIVLAVLIARQPSVWLRGATLGVIILVNLGQFWLRTYAPTDPPVDLMARDMVNSQLRATVPANPDPPTFRAYMRLGNARSPEPGGGMVYNSPGSYYLRLYSQTPLDDASIVRHGAFHTRLNSWDFQIPANIQRDLQRSPQIERFVTWTSSADRYPDVSDPVETLLKGSYRRVSEQWFPAYDHWTWRYRWTFCRREYVKLE